MQYKKTNSTLSTVRIQGEGINYYMFSSYKVAGSSQVTTRPVHKVDILDNERVNPIMIEISGWLISETLYNEIILKNPIDAGVQGQGLLDFKRPTYIDSDLVNKVNNNMIKGNKYEIIVSSGTYEDATLIEYGVRNDMKGSMVDLDMVFQKNHDVSDDGIITQRSEGRLLGGYTNLSELKLAGKNVAAKMIDNTELINVDLEEIEGEVRVFKEGLYFDTE